MRGLRLALACLVCAGCQDADDAGASLRRGAAGSAGDLPSARLLWRRPLGLGRLVGVSGLARGEGGSLWAIPERIHVLALLSLGETGAAGRGPPIAIEGVPPGADTESLAWLGDGLLAVGTETQEPRDADAILLVRLQEGRARLVDALRLDYAAWGIRAEKNRGVEGLCAVGSTLLAGVETVIGTGDARWAPLGRLDRKGGGWTPFRVRLTTATGKLSSLECRGLPGGDTLEVFAIERHYGVARLLRFELPTTGVGVDLGATTVADLGALVPGIPNMEGLAFVAGDRLAILTDNDTGGVTGPTEIMLLELPPAPVENGSSPSP